VNKYQNRQTKRNHMTNSSSPLDVMIQMRTRAHKTCTRDRKKRRNHPNIHPLPYQIQKESLYSKSNNNILPINPGHGPPPSKSLATERTQHRCFTPRLFSHFDKLPPFSRIILLPNPFEDLEATHVIEKNHSHV